MLSAEHRFSGHFSVLANYTYSHCIADPQTTELSAPVYTDPSNRRFDRGNCTSVDMHHNFNLSGVLQSPQVSSRTLQWIAGNWRLAPIVSAHTGSYFTVMTGLDNAYSGIPGQRPNQVLANPYCVPKGVNCWINASAFAMPAAGTLGNEGVNNLLGPVFLMWTPPSRAYSQSRKGNPSRSASKCSTSKIGLTC